MTTPVSSRGKTLSAAAIVLLIGLRLYLGGDRDIVATNSVYDEYWYVSSALRAIWGGAYNHMAFAHLPVYSAWIAGLYGLGIPARLAIDLAWLASIGYLAFALNRFTRSRWPGFVAFACLAFHPYSFLVFDRALAETLLTVLSAFALAGFIEAWNCREGGGSKVRRWLALAATTLGFAAAYHVRKEGALVLLPLLILGALSIAQRRRWWGAPGWRAYAFPLLILPVASVVLLGFLIALGNAVRWGIPARHELAAPGYVAAVEALNAIDPGVRTPRHVTITSATRAAAYSASPTFAELRGFFEGPPGQFLVKYTEQFTGVPGEIGNGWFYWALRDAAAGAGWHAKGAVAADAKYRAVADELQKAFAAGTLRRRMVLPGFIDPDAGKWIGEVPRAGWRVLSLAWAPGGVPLQSPREDANALQLQDFVRALGRRRLPQSAVAAGWVKAPEGSAVALGNESRSFAWKDLVGPTRPDVPGAYPFRLAADPGEAASQLHLRFRDGTLYRLPLEHLAVGKMAHFGVAEVVAGIDQLSLGTTRYRLEIAAIVSLARAWTWVGYVLGIAGIAGLLVAALRRRPQDTPIAVVAVLALVACVARAALLGILDATSWSGVQARYMFPVVPLFVTFGVLGAFLALPRGGPSADRPQP